MRIQKSFERKETGVLTLVPTPIGNLQDMTFRSVEVLRDVELILSEDTRNTQKLLNHFEITTKQLSFHEHNVQKRIPEILRLLKSGVNIAQVSDAGMPSISDPGVELVDACVRENLQVVSLPGATAGVTALISSGLSPQPFTFYGFLPRKKKEQIEFFEENQTSSPTQIFYESPYRIKATLENMLSVYGDRNCVVARELTKIYEEYRRGTISELIESFVQPPKGEIVLIVEGGDGSVGTAEDYSAMTLKEHVSVLISAGLTQKEAIKEVAKLRGIKKQEVYHAVHISEEDGLD
ncbi:MAG: 16S rRNA (cytidine(1402)-2'-O)-methyltransferase [Streptococcaceae bacterium]|jgi:16S rRNA (cytidine1402-2'-O)-methyltransferase|nr:16S rRNA (cytidine(1402)-2'-O)-methyltransferase [Streptococcaceae bacterium]